MTIGMFYIRYICILLQSYKLRLSTFCWWAYLDWKAIYTNIPNITTHVFAPQIWVSSPKSIVLLKEWDLKEYLLRITLLYSQIMWATSSTVFVFFENAQWTTECKIKFEQYTRVSFLGSHVHVIKITSLGCHVNN